MELAVRFPGNEVGNDIGAIREFAQSVEGLGFSHLVRGDRSLGANATAVLHEPLIFFSYLASITSRLGLMTGVLILGERQTVLVAKQAAELDFLSGGRLRLGVAVGGRKPEFDALNVEFDHRGSRIVEQFAVLRALWTQEAVTFDGRWHHIANAGINPMPVQRPIPLWMGGRSEVVLRRAGRIADGWIVDWDSGETQDAVTITPYWEQVLASATAAGRDLGSFGFQGTLDLTKGGPDDWARLAEDWQKLGATVVVAATVGLPGSVADHIGRLRQLKEAVG